MLLKSICLKSVFISSLQEESRSEVSRTLPKSGNCICVYRVRTEHAYKLYAGCKGLCVECINSVNRIYTIHTKFVEGVHVVLEDRRPPAVAGA